jgi:hypothetical protein
MRARVRPAAPLAALLLAALLPFAWAGERALAARGPEAAAQAYLAALCGSGNVHDVSSGRARFQAAVRDLPRAELVRADAAAAALGKGWAEVLAFAELKLADGSHDCGWYRTTVVREGGGWKVVSFAEADPWPSGSWPFASARDVSAAREAFAGYLEALAGNRYAEAVRFLCGPARRAHEAGAAVLGKAPLFREAEVSSLVPVWRRGNLMACRAEYAVDGRKAGAVVRYAKLSDAWHILGVDQI